MDWSSYLLGLATLPVLAAVGFVGWMIGQPAGSKSSSCRGPCDPEWEIEAGKHEPWWVWELRSEHEFSKHIMSNPGCLERANYWLEKRGMPGRWTPKGFKKRAAA